MQSGQEMLEDTISSCREISQDLASQNESWAKSIDEIVEKFEEISNTFFFQTMPSVPPTRTAMREAATLLEAKTSGDWASFETQISTLISSAQTVIEKAGMKGTTLT
ncbi:MAG: hypothetical protein MK345_01525 [SAR202 cluster bacterium]|nr:hypothetical protein [SAR202 cluster bacterium]